MKLVPANIKSKKDFAQRMLDGEVFYNTFGDKMYYDENSRTTPFPFLFKDDGGEIQPLGAAWNSFDRVMVEIKWDENIPEEGVLCWVSDTSPNSRRYAEIIISKKEEEGYSYWTDECGWTYATPVTKEEVGNV